MIKNLIYTVITIALILTVAVLYFTQKKVPSSPSDISSYETIQNAEPTSNTPLLEMTTPTTSTDLIASTTPLFTSTTSASTSIPLKQKK